MKGYISKETAYKIICNIFENACQLNEKDYENIFKSVKSFIEALPEEKPE